MESINGKTRLFGIVADPVEQVKTPQSFNNFFIRNSINAVLVPLHISTNGLETALVAFREIKNLDGLVITVPHKTVVTELCDDLTPEAKSIGSVNTIKRDHNGKLIGAMFDGLGFVQGLAARGTSINNKSVLLIGGGGAAAAIAHALVRSGVGSLAITNRTQSKAEAIANGLRLNFNTNNISIVQPDPVGYDIVINATSLGMRQEDPLPIDSSLLSSNQLAAEIIMSPEMTPFLKQAQKAGAKIHLGHHMLRGQMKLMTDFFGLN